MMDIEMNDCSLFKYARRCFFVEIVIAACDVVE
jgi:hypothetical protein